MSPPATAPRPSVPPPSSLGRSAADKALFWDRMARKYAADPIADPAGYEHTLRRVQGLLSAGDRVLELGCGTGSTALRLAPHTRRYLATDVSPEMIAIAREKLAHQPTPQLRFAVADAEAHGLGDATFDAVLAFNLLHLTTDLDRALGTVVQALRPGGLFISKTPCIGEMNPLIGQVVAPLLRLIGKAPALSCFNEDQLQAALARRGLTVITTERHGTRRKDTRAFLVARRPG